MNRWYQRQQPCFAWKEHGSHVISDFVHVRFEFRRRRVTLRARSIMRVASRTAASYDSTLCMCRVTLVTGYSRWSGLHLFTFQARATGHAVCMCWTVVLDARVLKAQGVQHCPQRDLQRVCQTCARAVRAHVGGDADDPPSVSNASICRLHSAAAS